MAHGLLHIAKEGKHAVHSNVVDTNIVQWSFIYKQDLSWSKVVHTFRQIP